MKQDYFIYKYEWPDGSIYIGQTSHTAKRYGKISDYVGCNKVYNKMKKYPNFKKEIIEDNIPENKIDEREIYLVAYYNSYIGDNPDFGLNLTRGGQGTHGCIGHKHSYKQRKKHSEYMKNYYKVHTVWNKGKKLQSHENYNKELKGCYKKGHSFDKNTLKKMSDAKKKKVICVETGIIYDSAKDIAKLFNYYPSNITKCCLGKSKSAYGHTWRYI